MDSRSRNEARERTRQFIMAARSAVTEPYVYDQPIYWSDEVLYGQERGMGVPWFVVGSCSFLLLFGSGGTLNLRQLEAREAGGRPVFEQVMFTRTERQKTVSAQECIRALKSVFGLTLSDVADIMLVGRAAVYEWLAGVQPRTKSLERLWQLHGLAILWSQWTSVPIGNSVRTPFTDGHNLLGLLTADELVIADIHRDMRILAGVANTSTFVDRKPSVSERLRKGGFKPLSERTRAITKRQLGPSWVEEDE